LIVEVTLDTDTKEVLGKFQCAVQDAAEVMQAYYVTGDTDFVLLVAVRNMNEYQALAALTHEATSRETIPHNSCHAPRESKPRCANQLMSGGRQLAAMSSEAETELNSLAKSEPAPMHGAIDSGAQQ
jgi:DNA-binding Lrp family transcriptional regulator